MSLLLRHLTSAFSATPALATTQQQEALPEGTGIESDSGSILSRRKGTMETSLADIPGKPNGWRIVQTNRDAYLQIEQIQHAAKEAGKPGAGIASRALPCGAVAAMLNRTMYFLTENSAMCSNSREC